MNIIIQDDILQSTKSTDNVLMVLYKHTNIQTYTQKRDRSSETYDEEA